MPRLDGKVAIVTGAAADPKAALGAVFAKALAAEGAKVVVADAGIAVRSRPKSPPPAEQPTPSSRMFATRKAVAAMVAETEGKSAGSTSSSTTPPSVRTFRRSPSKTSTSSDGTSSWRSMCEALLCTRAAIPAMRRNNYGKIINLGSTTMLSGLSHRLHYVTCKGAIAAMTRSMARELGPSGIRVNTLAPGLVMYDSVAASMAGRPGLHDFVLSTRAIRKDVFADELVGTLIYRGVARQRRRDRAVPHRRQWRRLYVKRPGGRRVDGYAGHDGMTRWNDVSVAAELRRGSPRIAYHPPLL